MYNRLDVCKLDDGGGEPVDANTEDLILSGAYTFVDELQQHYTSYESLALRERNR
jgi:hypothetical protein